MSHAKSKDKGEMLLRVVSSDSINAVHAKIHEYETALHRKLWRGSTQERVYAAVCRGLRKILMESEFEGTNHAILQMYVTLGMKKRLTKEEQAMVMALIENIIIPLMKKDGLLPPPPRRRRVRKSA